ALANQGKIEEARDVLEQPLSLNPRSAFTHALLGGLYGELGQYEKGLFHCSRAIEIAPRMAGGHWNRASINLTLGKWEEGWRDYQYGKVNKLRPVRFVEPEWDGRATKRILVWSEQGFGDTIWASKLVRVLKEQTGAEIIIECQRDLVGILKGVADKVIAQPKDYGCLEEFDAHVSLMSLPHVLGLTPDTIPADKKWIHADHALAEAWKPGLEGRTIGLVWAGSAGHQNDRNRSIPTEAIKPLEKVRGKIVSLQMGKEAPFECLNLSESITDFSVTAAIIENLEVVVTVDTSVAHLSGAMGKKTFLMLPKYIDFRWMSDQKKTKWYPSMTIFRQKTMGDWSDVIAGVLNDLG
ncbi:MAG TPA: hypothetical protein VJQ25_03935, partial [Nitrospira sp.]|nr:hypothetical protein [Nitrospira sp.]